MVSIPANFLPVLKEEVARDGLRYMLAMYWQGRSDKIPSSLMPVLQWLTDHEVPSEQTGSREFAHGRVMFAGGDHGALLDAVMRRALLAANRGSSQLSAGE